MACLHHHSDSMWLKLVLGCWVITNHLLQQSNKDSRVPVWLHPLYSEFWIFAVYRYQSQPVWSAQTYNTQTGCVLWLRDYNKNQNFCGDESICRKIGSTQKRDLVKSGKHKNEFSWNRVNTKTKSREIGSTQKRNLMKSGQYTYWDGCSNSWCTAHRPCMSAMLTSLDIRRNGYLIDIKKILYIGMKYVLVDYKY